MTNRMDKKKMMEKLVREAHERGLFNGTWLYAENGKIVSKGAVGFRDVDDKLPMQEDSIFDIASVTKQFTSTAIMLLVRKGLVGLDDEITKYYPKLPYPGVTVRQLLTHTGGIPDLFEDISFFVRIWEEEHRIPDNHDVIRFLCESNVKAYFAPGDGFEYSNSGYCLLALIVEQVSGIPFEDFLRRNVFEPAGMNSTAVCHVRRDGYPSDNFVRSMVLEDGRYILPEESKNDDTVVAEDGTNGDGFVYSNIFDLLAWDRALREEKVLTREEQKLMYTPVELNSGEVYADEEFGTGYGFGWDVENDPELGLVVEHSGWHKGSYAKYERLVDADRLLVLLYCRDPEDSNASYAFYEGMRAIARDKEPQPIRTLEERMEQNPDKSAWESFCGKYAHEEGNTFYPEEVYLRDGELYVKWMRTPGDGFNWKLYPLGDNEFGIKKFDFTISFSEGQLTCFDEVYKRL